MYNTSTQSDNSDFCPIAYLYSKLGKENFKKLNDSDVSSCLNRDDCDALLYQQQLCNAEYIP